MSQSIDELFHELTDAVRTLSLIGASLKIRSKDDMDPEIRKQIMLGSRAVLGRDVAELEDADVAGLIGATGMAFAEASELFRHPDRDSGWRIEDATLLQMQGQASRSAFRRIRSLAKTRPLLEKTFEGRFLDVGTGVAGIALEAASICPSLFVDGIDIWEAALILARHNIAASPYMERIAIWLCDITQLEPGARYSLVWLPTMFMKRAVLEDALDRIVAASVSGSYLVASTYTQPDEAVARSFANLRTLRSGGDVLEPSDVANMMRARSYVGIESDFAPLATFTLGRLL